MGFLFLLSTKPLDTSARPLVKSVYQNINFLFSQAPKTYVKTDRQKNIYNFKLKNSVLSKPVQCIVKKKKKKKIIIIFLFLNQNICCGYLEEPKTNVKTDG